MYFCYIDESGDCGRFDATQPDKTGSRYFILTGFVVHAKSWKTSLNGLKSFRKEIAAQAILRYDVEFHCSELIDPHKEKAFTEIKVTDRWRLIEQFSERIGQNAAISIIAVVIDKTTSLLRPENYLTTAITKLYQSLDVFLGNKKEYGLVFFDRANEKIVTTHVRKLLGTGSSGDTITGIRIGWIIEDPIFRISSDSIFIQASDVIAFTLKEKMFPMSSRKKFNADKIFTNQLQQRCIHTTFSNDEGIIIV